MPLLKPGDPFPQLTMNVLGGGALTVPDGFAGDFATVLFYRGAALTGAFVSPDPVYLQSTGFVLNPEGNVVVSVYSSGAIGRLVPEDVIGLVRYRREHSPAATA